MRRKPLGSIRQARRTAAWRDEAARRLGTGPESIERMTATLAPAARASGGTEGDCLAIVRHVALVHQVTQGDVDQVIEDTVDAWASGLLEGVSGSPLNQSIRSPTQAQTLTIGAVRLALPQAFERWSERQQLKD